MKTFNYEEITIEDIERNSHLNFICDGDSKKVIVEREEENGNSNI